MNTKIRFKLGLLFGLAFMLTSFQNCGGLKASTSESEGDGTVHKLSSAQMVLTAAEGVADQIGEEAAQDDVQKQHALDDLKKAIDDLKDLLNNRLGQDQDLQKLIDNLLNKLNDIEDLFGQLPPVKVVLPPNQPIPVQPPPQGGGFCQRNGGQFPVGSQFFGNPCPGIGGACGAAVGPLLVCQADGEWHYVVNGKSVCDPQILVWDPQGLAKQYLNDLGCNL